MDHNRRTLTVLTGYPMRIVGFMFAVGCRSPETRPVDIFPEDNCSQCRMAISNERFASEIMNADGDVIKFDDVGCFLKYRANHPDMKTSAMFMKEYDSKNWLRYERAVIIETDIETPMGSGKVVFADSMKAREFQKQHPSTALSASSGCGGSCCSDDMD